jgi:hypothetical protein
MRLKGTQLAVIDVKLHWHHNSKVSQPALCLVDVMHQLAVKESLKLTRISLLSQQISVVHSDICYLWFQQSFLEGNQLWPKLVIFTNPFLCDTLHQALTSIRSKHIFVSFMTDPSATVSTISYLKHVFMNTDIPPYDSTWIELRDEQLIRFHSTETSDWLHNSNKYWQAWRRGRQTLQNRFNRTKNWGVW